MVVAAHDPRFVHGIWSLWHELVARTPRCGCMFVYAHGHEIPATVQEPPLNFLDIAVREESKRTRWASVFVFVFAGIVVAVFTILSMRWPPSGNAYAL